MRSVFITGGSRGIGAAIASKYESCGYKVIAPTRNDLDLSQCESIKAFFDRFNEPIDVLVNNAGINPVNNIVSTNNQDLQQTIDINLVAPFLLLKSMIPLFRKKSGYNHVVNISSIWAGVAKPGRVAYAMSKSGLEGLTRTAAVELGTMGILVNSVAPGFTLTELTLQNNGPTELEQIKKNIPLGKFANPSEIAEVVYFFGSEHNSYVTGQTIFADGGFTCI